MDPSPVEGKSPSEGANTLTCVEGTWFKRLKLNMMSCFHFLISITKLRRYMWALFVRDTAAGPGGELGKGVVALRKEAGTRRPLLSYC
jgi:hypothetical protein